MDHLYNLGEVEAVQVPLYGDNTFDSGPFSTFPDRQGFNKKDLLEVFDHQGRSPDSTASFFQSWLYFGFLTTFFKDVESFETSAFCRTAEDGTRVITTAELPKYLGTWASQARAQCNEIEGYSKQLAESIDSLFAEVFSAGDKFIGDARAWPHDRAPKVGVPEPLALSIIVLFEALSKAAKQVTKQAFNYDWQTSRLLIERMKTAGWCSNELNFLARMKIDTLFSASTMMRPNAHREHARCTAHLCKAEQVEDNASYAAKCRKHVKDCQGCCEVSVNPHDVATIIENDAVPVLQYDYVHNRIDVRSIILSKSSSLQPYIALSHVWADGLGNPTQNSLYACQLIRIQDLMDKLGGDSSDSDRVMWWCDTLCVPVGSQFKQTRRRAIVKMRRIYQDASSVLVVDGDLSSRSSHCSIIDAYLRIITSTWMRRLWTFQEGFVASKLYLQFDEGAVALATFQSVIMETTSYAPEFLYWWCDNDFTEFLGIFTVDYSKHTHLVSTAIFRNAQWRSTSWASDETICLANIHGFDIESLLEIPDTDLESRMVWFLEKLENVPASLLFQKEPRLKLDHFRWAPNSFMQCFRNSGLSWLYDKKPRIQVLKDHNGAKAILPGVLLETKSDVHLDLTLGFAFCLSSQPELCFVAIEYSDIAPPSMDAKNPQTFKRPAIILYETPSPSGAFKLCDTGVLVDVAHDENAEEIQVNYVTLVGLANVPRNAVEVVAQNVANFTFLQGTPLLEQQKWHIV